MDSIEINYKENKEIIFLKQQIKEKDEQIKFLQEEIKNLWREK